VTPAIPESVVAAARRLTGEGAVSIALAGSGANSRIFRVDGPGGPIALKSYPARSGDTRNRQDVEWRALAFLQANGLRCVPTPLARDEAGRFTALSWIDGAPVPAPTDADIRAAMDLIAAVFALSDRPEAAAFPAASEACLSSGAILRQIEERLAHFAPHPALDAFLAGELRPALAAARAGIAATSLDAPLPPGDRRLIPADFGFHNALRTADGTLVFIDFEYFGWDDPAKLTADILLHPGFRLTAAQKAAVAARATAALSSDADFAGRLARLLPLFRLRWCLILLNAFRHDRIAASGGDLDLGLLHTALDNQLAKARMMLTETG
jgi:hypothetical protein